MRNLYRGVAKLPSLLERKIYKTGQTRGADDDVIYQNRVSRNSPALFPLSVWETVKHSPDFPSSFENGYILLVPPKIYFDNHLESEDIIVGQNALLFYETRQDWTLYNPEMKKLTPATNRNGNLGGQYVARIPATTASSDSQKINIGFTANTLKGAGIRGYEYASLDTVIKCRIQLEYLFWSCYDAIDVLVKSGMQKEDALKRKKKCQEYAVEYELIDLNRLIEIRAIDSNHRTICPLCLEHISANGFFNRLEQAYGREVPDLTVTEINLFHIRELRYGEFNHKPYNLGWGHHHCNVVTKDSGISETLIWMEDVVKRNKEFNQRD